MVPTNGKIVRRLAPSTGQQGANFRPDRHLSRRMVLKGMDEASSGNARRIL